jgi:DNA-binding NtrC family response regulator
LIAATAQDLAQAVASGKFTIGESRLGEAQGNKTEAARILGVQRPLLYEQLSELGLG